MGHRTLVVGDVHGCAWELKKLLKKAQPDRVILAGDLFTRGPDARGVWNLICATRAEAVLGNHDVAVINTWKPGKKLPRAAHRWLKRLPHAIHGKGWSVVHAGINPERGARKTKPERAIFKKLYQGDPWWLRYRRKRLIIHGHDAATGLNDRRPYALGLDTGCVRGAHLTGYLIEADRLIQVSARQRYR